MNSKILLVGGKSESIQETNDLLASNKLYKLIRTENAQDAIRRLAQDKANIVIFDNEVLTEEKMAVAKNLRGLGYSAPIVMLAKAIAPKARDHLKYHSKLVILEKPFEHKHFLGVISKLLEGKEVPQQTHKRFYTDQSMTLELIGKNGKYEGSMLNLSKGGAYLEVKDETAEFRGIIKMKVSLNEVDKQYEVQARVVWNSKASIWGKGQGVGVEFIQAKDVYRNLLNNL